MTNYDYISKLDQMWEKIIINKKITKEQKDILTSKLDALRTELIKVGLD